MSTVFIPQVLRPEVGGAKTVQIEGGTIGEVVDVLVERHPSLADRLLTPDGELHRFVNVYLNGQDVRYLEGRETKVGDRDEVRLLPAIAGGR